MIAERAAGLSVDSIQSKKSLTEAIALGFAGIGFGGKSPVLGGPLTSASRLASSQVNEADEPDEDAEDEDGVAGAPEEDEA